MLYSAAKTILLALAAGSLGGCGPAAEPPAAAALPPALQGARLLYQRPDGIHLRVLGEDRSTLLVAIGTYPRWAPDGQSFVFLRGRQVVRYAFRDGSEKIVAEADQPRALAFHPDGRRILFTDGKQIKSVPVDGGAPSVVLSGPRFYELDAAASGDFLVATVKSFGYRVQRFDLPAGTATEIGRGCSASLSPDDRLATVNLAGHGRLALRDSRTGAERGELRAPAGYSFDNQKWANHPDWIVVVSEGDRRDVYAQRVGDGQVWRLADNGDADRPDLFVPP